VPHNIYVWLKHSPQTHGAIRYNRLTNEIETQGGHFAGVDQEVLDTAIVDYMQVHFGVSFNKTDVRDRILRVAYENGYDPLQDYLNALVWDGVPRLDNFFLGEEYVAKNKAGEDVTVPAYVTARRTNKAGEDITPYLKLIAPKVFISGAARALWPGPECQVDTMLVLEGTSEGEGKTRLIRTLAGPWYIQTRLALDNKDSQMIPAGNFLVELGELSSVRKSEGDALKSFLSEIIDKFRLPYGKTIKPFFRRCIFIGTTNDEEWLSYDKGERRWWPVYVQAINHPAVLRDRDQLWAEAVVRLKAKERWHLEGKEENALARNQARQRIEPTMLENLLEHWWRGMSDSTRTRLTFISKVDLYKDALKLSEEALLRMPSGTEAKVAKAMKRMGFERGAAGTLQGWVPAGQPATVAAEEKPKGSVSYMKLVHGEAGGKK
jgi:predicted P-loop ATPase